MNMKMDEQKQNSAAAKTSKFNNGSDDDLISIGSSAQLDSKDDSKLQTLYEGQLQKYEAEVRNHIKIEQQLKLHIECVQDKLDDTEKLVKKFESEREQLNETKQELSRYKDLLKLREIEIEKLKRSNTNYKQIEVQMQHRIQELELEQHENSPTRLVLGLDNQSKEHNDM